jgi:broad specificity phosphatase PhoE
MSVNINLSNNRLCKARRIVNGSVKGSDLSSKNVKIVHFVRHAQVILPTILYICSYVRNASEAFEQ